MKSELIVSEEVAAAIAARRPVVALETTIVSHGMPWPQNIETALAVEAIVREGGAVPAAIAVIDGAIRVGLDRAMLERLAKEKGVLKLSRADLAYARGVGQARRHHRRRHHDRRPPRRHFRSSPPAASAASTAAPRRPSTSPPI